MSEPITRPFDEPLEMDCEVPPVPGLHVSGTAHSTKQETHIDNSKGKRINDALPWFVIAIVATVACSMSGIALGLAIGARDDALEAKRIAERETRLQRLETDELKVALKSQGLKIHED